MGDPALRRTPQAAWTAGVAQASTDAVDVAGNYQFATTTTGSLTDMSFGTVELLGPDGDDDSTVAIDIGFDFFFQGVRYSQFSVNRNGVLQLGSGPIQAGGPYPALGQAALPLITA